MLWQDWVISSGQVILALALIPTIRSREKPPLSTSLTTAVVIAVITLTLSTLHLWLSAISAGVISSSWFLISYQKFRQKK